jgi:hypothetical protein
MSSGVWGRSEGGVEVLKGMKTVGTVHLGITVEMILNILK